MARTLYQSIVWPIIDFHKTSIGNPSRHRLILSGHFGIARTLLSNTRRNRWESEVCIPSGLTNLAQRPLLLGNTHAVLAVANKSVAHGTIRAIGYRDRGKINNNNNEIRRVQASEEDEGRRRKAEQDAVKESATYSHKSMAEANRNHNGIKDKKGPLKRHKVGVLIGEVGAEYDKGRVVNITNLRSACVNHAITQKVVASLAPMASASTGSSGSDCCVGNDSSDQTRLRGESTEFIEETAKSVSIEVKESIASKIW
ncbi:hypothetical protein BDP27DRAFT_1403026 [Rhodocollybia butyracea]|uniref:Uncharacterized protein n=1 Tax=Rhodocollybia butyracea TaxID=206335 RepID=A0A9P5PT13_9AGAR|nr:hypothetical protein BDP27DRAFT_1403026 [Rhodocollybia butyracea]